MNDKKAVSFCLSRIGTPPRMISLKPRMAASICGVFAMVGLTRIVPNYSAKFCGIIPSNPELAAGERGKIPHLREDDGFRIRWQATPARRIGQRAERDEQTNHGF